MSKEEVEKLIEEWDVWNMKQYEIFGMFDTFEYFLFTAKQFEYDKINEIVKTYKELIYG